jgi:hypothetical protein
MRLFSTDKLETGWIIVNHWDTFQHYKDRRPPWIKNYTELLDDPDYLRLTVGERSLLHGIWLMYASHHGQLPLDARYLSRQLNIRATSQQLEALNDAGWITLSASKPLANRLHDASPRARPRARGEAEKEKENPPNPPNGGPALTRKTLRQYTGCERTRGTHSTGYRHTTLGTDKPPSDWPHPRPTDQEVRVALARQWIQTEGWKTDDDHVRHTLAHRFAVNGDDELELLDLAADRRSAAEKT